MKYALLPLVLLLVAACQTNEQPPELRLGEPQGVVTSNPQTSTSPSSASSSSAAVSSVSASATPASSTSPAVHSTKTWKTLTGMSTLHGKWVHHTKGDALDHGKLIKGGARIIFSQNPDSRTPWNLRFWVPKDGHMSSETVSGGCGFYEEVHDDSWRTAFCKGYGMDEGKGAKLELVLQETTSQVSRTATSPNGQGTTRSNDPTVKLRLVIGNLIDVVLVKQ